MAVAGKKLFAEALAAGSMEGYLIRVPVYKRITGKRQKEYIGEHHLPSSYTHPGLITPLTGKQP